MSKKTWEKMVACDAVLSGVVNVWLPRLLAFGAALIFTLSTLLIRAGLYHVGFTIGAGSNTQFLWISTSAPRGTGKYEVVGIYLLVKDVFGDP